MSKFTRGLVVAALSVLGTLAVSGAVRACDPPCCYERPCYEYKPVICYETRCEPCVETVKCYDECGHPYCKEITVYHEVRFAVTKYVKVWY